MPAYNVEKYIREAIESILKQTYTNWELIIIDDASEDNTCKVIKTYESEQIKLLRNKRNLGLAQSLNIAYQQAKGKYLFRLDSDDVALSNRIAEQVNFMEKYPEIVACSSVIEYFGREHGYWHPPFKHSEIICYLLFSAQLTHSASIIRKNSLLDNAIEYNTRVKIAEDYDLWCRLAKVGKLANLPEVLTKVRKHGNSTTQDKVELKKCLNLVRLQQLRQNLNISPSEAELQLHHEFSHYPEVPVDLAYLKRAEAWLAKLARANQETNYYAEPEFSEMLRKLWYKLSAGRQDLGWGFGKLFSRSQFSEYQGYSLWQKMKFWAKCGLYPHLPAQKR